MDPGDMMNMMKQIDLGLTPDGPKHFKMDTEDLVALAAVVLCIGGTVAAVIVAIGLALGRIEGQIALKIILGCVGGSFASGVLGAIVKRKSSRRPRA